MKRFLLLAALLPACTFSTKDMNLAMGGKGAYKGKTFGVTWDNESSFREAAMLGAIGVGAWQAVAGDRAASAASINASNNATKQAIKKIDADTAIELGKQAQPVEILKATPTP